MSKNISYYNIKIDWCGSIYYVCNVDLDKDTVEVSLDQNEAIHVTGDSIEVEYLNDIGASYTLIEVTQP